MSRRDGRPKGTEKKWQRFLTYLDDLPAGLPQGLMASGAILSVAAYTQMVADCAQSFREEYGMSGETALNEALVTTTDAWNDLVGERLAALCSKNQAILEAEQIVKQSRK